MSNKNLAKVSSTKEVPCMLLPMVGHTLIIPTTSVAEMSSVGPLEARENAPDWLMGMYSWRGISVPVISIERLNGGDLPKLNTGGRIAVLNNTGVDKRVHFTAIHTQGIPRMARVTENDIEEDDSVEKRPYDIMAVKVGMEEFYMPDIPALEREYAKLLD